MSGHKYITDTNNLFTDEVDDDTFLRNSRHSQQNTNYLPSPTDSLRRLEEQKMSLMERRKEIEDRTVRSTQRSLGLLKDSEQVGIATAEELQRQREQLERTDKRLDEINSTLRFSQKHLNGIKSVFGSLKNYLSGRNEAANLAAGNKAGSNQTFGDNKVNSASVPSMSSARDTYSTHPLTRIRSEDDSRTGHIRYDGNDVNPQAIIDANLEEMCGSIVRLKGLAVELSSEIDSQNDLIDNITDKTDVTGLTVNKQTKEMNKILGKK